VLDRGRYISARGLYGQHVNEEWPRSVEELAEDFELPIAAVQEAIAYCESDPPEICQDWAAEEALSEAIGMNDPNYNGQPKKLPLRERVRFNDL
jgi:hypothetical protein